MDFDNQYTLWIAYLGSNIAGILMLIAAVKKPRLARLLFMLLFAWACYINWTTARSQPTIYLDYSNHALDLYARFIEGWFSKHITLIVSTIALGQGLIALGMLLKGLFVRLASIGAMIFLLAIAPLGFYAAFPFSLTVAAAAYIVLRRDDLNYVWRGR